MAMKIKLPSKSAEKNNRLTLRISGRDKFALELLAQNKKTTLSALVLELCGPELRKELTFNKRNEEIYIPAAAYATLAPDRLVKLAQVAPEYLDDREQVLWTIIQENPKYWKGKVAKYSVIRQKWEAIQRDADYLIKIHG